MPRSLRRALLVALSLGLFSPIAEAHGVMVGANDFIAGLLHPLTAMEDALTFFMFGVVTSQNGLRRSEFVLWLLPLAVVAGAAGAVFAPGIPATNLINILSLVALGLLVALAKRMPLPVLAGAVIFFGLSHGYANGAEIGGQIKPAVFISGVGLSTVFLVAYGAAITDFLLKRQATWLPIAVRVSGSWSAAIGLLVLSVSPKAALFS